VGKPILQPLIDHFSRFGASFWTIIQTAQHGRINMSKLPQLTKDERLTLKTLTPRGRHIDVCINLEAQSGWDASTPINRLLKLKLVKRVKRGHYERVA
jgi:hypothetical protein